MANFRRINIDGKLINETRLLAEDTLAGTVVVIDDNDHFAVSADGSGRIYVVGAAYSQGLKVDDVIPAGSSVQSEYVEEGRELVVRAVAGEYKKDQPLGVAGGKFTASDTAIAYAQQDATITDDNNLLRIRVK